MASSSSDSEYSQVTANIRTLTCILDGVLTAKPNFASESLPSRHRLDIVVHIANLADNGLPPALAATAVARPDGTTAIVICADGPSSGLSGTQNGVSVHSQVVKQSSVVDLDRSPESPIPITEYLSDLLHIFGSGAELSSDRLGLWVLCCSWRKLSLRVGTYQREWEEPPHESISHWEPSPEDLRVLRSSPTFTRRFSAHLSRTLLAAGLQPDEDRMIVPDDSSLPFTFKPEDASKWVNVVAAILRRLDIAFPGGRAEDDPGPAPDKDTLSQVNLDIFDLALLSEFEPLDSILAHTSLTKRFRSTSCPRSRWDPSGAGREQLPIYYLPNLGACVSSFLRALASSHAALLRLLHYRNIQGRKLSLEFIQFNGVILPRSGDLGTTDLKQAIHKEMDERLPRFGRQASLPNASKWLEERIKAFQVKHYIHAEAGLMALAVASRSDVRSAVPDDVQDILCSMVDGGQLFVGTTKMCCWTCWRLGELLYRFTRDSAQRSPVEVRLPGQRGVTYAWDPPPGIPLEVLKTLEADLLTALADHAIRCTLVKPGAG